MSSINFITSGASVAGSGVKQSNILQAATNIVPNPLSVITSSSSPSNQLQITTTTSATTTLSDGTTTTTSSSSNENLTNQQLTQMALHSWNPKMLQKIAQRLIVDTSNTGGDQTGGNQTSNTSSPNTSGSSSDESGAEGLSPPMLNVKQNSNSKSFRSFLSQNSLVAFNHFPFLVQLNLELSDVDLAAISSTFCSQLAQVHQHVSNIIQQKPGNVSR